MKEIQYDKEVDAAYLEIEDAVVVESEEIAQGVIVDYNENDQIVAVELLDVQKLSLSNLNQLLPLLPEAAQIKLQDFFPSFAVT